MNRKMEKWRKLPLYMAAWLGIIILGVLAYLWNVENISEYAKRKEVGYEIVSDYSCEVKQNESLPAGVAKEYRMQLDNIGNRDKYFAFYVIHQYAEVYIEGKLVYSLMPAPENEVGKTVGGNWVIVPVYREDAGKEIFVRLIPVYKSEIKEEPQFLVGGRMEIYNEQLISDFPQIVLSIVTFLIGVVYLFASLYICWKEKKNGASIALSVFAMMMGIWRLTDSKFASFIIPEKTVFLIYSSGVMLMLAFFPMLRYARGKFHKCIEKKVLDICCVVSMLICYVQITLQIFNIKDLRETIWLTYTMIILNVAVIIGNAVYERKCISAKQKKVPYDLTILICVLGVALDGVEYYINGEESKLLFSLSAFWIYLLINGVIMIVRYEKHQKVLKEQEEKLAKSHVALMLSQIQPHFLYNSLGAIRELCKQDPEQAREAIGEFSTYLRGNMDALGSMELVPFSKELRHVETYLNLEKMRFEERLRIVYDIEEEHFYLPSLTVQPLVENAVKYGIFSKKEGGTITLRTRKHEEEIVISVIDDGIGFDPEHYESEERMHVGIRNVRTRLEQMADGKLIIESVPGKGTTASIILETRYK